MDSPLAQDKAVTLVRNVPTTNQNWYFLFFVVSGFCGLVYEVVWLRLAMASFGVTTILVSIVLSMFMAGLGLGSALGGILARETVTASGQKAMGFYSLAELLIGFSSIAVPLQLKFGRILLLHWGSFGTWQSLRYYALAGLWIAITLVPWCTCMGSTFPLLMAVIKQNDPRTSERSFSYLYFANVVGALFGTVASAFVIIELVGLRGTLRIAGILNLILAALAFRLSLHPVSSSDAVIEKRISSSAVRRRLYGLPPSAVLIFLFTTGLVSMGMEVIWIRQLTPYLGNVVYAFAAILAVYLLSTVVGSQDYRNWACFHAPSESAPIWSLLALFALIPLAAADPRLPLHIGSLQLAGIRVAGIVLFCGMTGFLTPLLVDFWSSGDPDQAGTAYAINVAGSIVGPLVAGIGLIPWLGERLALIVLSIPLFLIAALVVLQNRRSEADGAVRSGARLKLTLAIIAGILLCSLTRDYETKFVNREVRRDYAATVIATGEGFDRQLLVNGTGMTRLAPVTKYMAHLPLAFMSRPPNNGLVICFGMGTSFRSMLSWGIPTTAVDLIPSVPALFAYYHPDAPKLLNSPLAKIVIDDGRRFLDASDTKFDVIVVDPPPPVAATGSSLLYSSDFYEVVKQHLSEDGILQMWYPRTEEDPVATASVAKALREAFVWVKAFPSAAGENGIHFLAGMQPHSVSSIGTLVARMPQAAVADFLEWGPESDAKKQFEVVISAEIPIEKLIDEGTAPAIQDDEPINEYFLLRRWFGYHR